MRQRGIVFLGKRRSFSAFLFEVLSFLYIAHKILPAVGHYMPGVVYLGLVAAVFVFAFFISVSKTTVSASVRLLAVFGVSLLEFVRYLIKGSVVSGATYMYGEVQIFLYALIAIAFIYRNDYNQIKNITNLIFVSYAITAITTFIGNNKYEGASRLLATLDNSDPTRQLYASQNIGGFVFIYELVLIVPLIIYMIKKKRMNRALGWGLIILLGMTIMSSEYTTALLMYVFSLTLFLIPKITKRKIIILVVILVILFIINSLYFADLFEYLGETVQSETLAQRFGELAELLREGESSADGNATNRMDLYKKSINAFFESGMMGVWNDGGIGGHSFMFDTMGRYGLIGVFAIIVMYRMIYKMFIGPYRREDFYPYLFFIYMIAIFMAFINPKTYLFIFICLIPLFAQKMVIKRIEREGF